MNRRCRSDMPNEQLAATSGVKILPIISPSGLKTWIPSPADTYRLPAVSHRKPSGTPGSMSANTTGLTNDSPPGVTSKRMTRWLRNSPCVRPVSPIYRTDSSGENAIPFGLSKSSETTDIARVSVSTRNTRFRSCSGLSPCPNSGCKKAVIRVGEPNRTVRLHNDIVR